MDNWKIKNSQAQLPFEFALNAKNAGFNQVSVVQFDLQMKTWFTTFVFLSLRILMPINSYAFKNLYLIRFHLLRFFLLMMFFLTHFSLFSLLQHPQWILPSPWKSKLNFRLKTEEKFDDTQKTHILNGIENPWEKFFFLFIDSISMSRQLETGVIANLKGNSLAIPTSTVDEFSVRQFSISSESPKKTKHLTTQTKRQKMCVFTPRDQRTNGMTTAGVLLHILFLLAIGMSIVFVVVYAWWLVLCFKTHLVNGSMFFRGAFSIRIYRIVLAYYAN